MRASRPRTRTVTTDHTADTEVPLGGVDQVVFKHPAISLLGVALFTLCLATVAGPWLMGRAIVDHGSSTGPSSGEQWIGWLILILPLVAAAWLLRVRTVVGAGGIRIVRLTGSTSIDWLDLSGLRLAKSGAVYAVRTDRTEVRLPAVTFGQLSRMSVASGGRIPDLAADVAGTNSPAPDDQTADSQPSSSR